MRGRQLIFLAVFQIDKNPKPIDHNGVLFITCFWAHLVAVLPPSKKVSACSLHTNPDESGKEKRSRSLREHLAKRRSQPHSWQNPPNHIAASKAKKCAHAHLLLCEAAWHCKAHNASP